MPAFTLRRAGCKADDPATDAVAAADSLAEDGIDCRDRDPVARPRGDGGLREATDHLLDEGGARSLGSGGDGFNCLLLEVEGVAIEADEPRAAGRSGFASIAPSRFSDARCRSKSKICRSTRAIVAASRTTASRVTTDNLCPCMAAFMPE